ncbi:MAG: hypothetical protein M4579_001453 [Chaenotheca gracillima]|nr:MAG: hypothetical protein M4579_001453 [Chaenotheca gracillima]
MVPGWNTYLELFKGQDMLGRLAVLHAKYGDVVRVAPNELHFIRPSAYSEIYLPRWDKEENFYASFLEPSSSFGFAKYRDAKQRRDVLNPLFSRRSIVNLQRLTHEKVVELCDALETQYATGESANLFFGFRAYTADNITSFCYANCINALKAPGFRAPIIDMMMGLSILPRIVRNFPMLRPLFLNAPIAMLRQGGPNTKALADLKVMIGKQISDLVANPKTLLDAPHPIIYSRMLDPEAQKGHPVPSETSLTEEAIALLFGGVETTANTLMLGTFYILSDPVVYKNLKVEILEAWPKLENHPLYEDLEKLPYLTAVIKEALRLTPGTLPGLPRIIPRQGATIADKFVPPETVVSMSYLFVHTSEDIFPNHEAFNPERWLGPDSKGLDHWLLAFSKGPRACIGMNLAWAELYLAFAHVFRRFDVELDKAHPFRPTYIDQFLPQWTGGDLRAFMKPVSS